MFTRPKFWVALRICTFIADLARDNMVERSDADGNPAQSSWKPKCPSQVPGCTCRRFVCCICFGAELLILGAALLLLWAYWACIILPKESGRTSYSPPAPNRPRAATRAGSRMIRILSYNLFLRPFYVYMTSSWNLSATDKVCK